MYNNTRCITWVYYTPSARAMQQKCVSEWVSEWVSERATGGRYITYKHWLLLYTNRQWVPIMLHVRLFNSRLPSGCIGAYSPHTHRIQNTVRSVFRSELASFSSAVAAAVCWTIWYTRHCTSAAERTFNHNEACQCMLYITANAIILSKWKKIANELSAHGTLYMKNTFLQQQQQNNNNMNKKLPS